MGIVLLWFRLTVEEKLDECEIWARHYLYWDSAREKTKLIQDEPFYLKKRGEKRDIFTVEKSPAMGTTHRLGIETQDQSSL